MIVIIDRFFNAEREKTCQILKTKKYSAEEMLNIIGAITVLYNHYGKNTDRIDELMVKNILEKHFECKDVKHKYVKELPFISFRLNSKILLQGYNLSGELVVWMDVDEIAEMCQDKSLRPTEQTIPDEKKASIIAEMKTY